MVKGQAAFEFLMTYSWAILIIGIVIGLLLFYGFFNPGHYIRPEVLGFSTFYIKDGGWKLTSDGKLSLIAHNQIDHRVKIINFYIDDEKIPVSIDLEPGETKLLLDNYQLSGKSGSLGSNYKLKVAIEYNDTITKMTHNDTGTIIGKYE